MPEFRAGQIILLRYKSQEIKAIIIDPNGLRLTNPLSAWGFAEGIATSEYPSKRSQIG
jgi:hypothetical protein